MSETLEDLRIEQAELVLPAAPFLDTLRFFIETLGFRLDSIMPADDPQTARLSGHGLRLSFDPSFKGNPGVIRLLTASDRPREPMTAPNQTRIVFAPARPTLKLPEWQPRLNIEQLAHGDAAWKSGRAGMLYRDLIPDRQGGKFIASHIRIPHGGPVGDAVHYHDVRVQLIYCYRGWVRLVYEDQGEPFLMRAGDCVLQPPHIRHRVLESSDGLEVIEIGSPAKHMTHLDHDMVLPTGRTLPGRDFGGQKFIFHHADRAEWIKDADTGLEMRDLEIAAATRGLASACVVRRASGWRADNDSAIQRKTFAFAFVLDGKMRLCVDQKPQMELHAGDAFVIPHGMQKQFTDCSDDWQLLQVFLPG